MTERAILLNKEVLEGTAKLYIKPSEIDAICERQQGTHSFILVSGEWIAIMEKVQEIIDIYEGAD